MNNTATEKLNFLPDVHISKDTAYTIEDYPYGYTLRTTMYIWIEYKKWMGYRVARQTINPKTGKENKPKFSTYSEYIRLYTDENKHINTYCFDFHSVDSYEKARAVWFFDESNIEPHHELLASHMMRDKILFMTWAKRWVINWQKDEKQYPQLSEKQNELLKENTYESTKIVHDELKSIS